MFSVSTLLGEKNNTDYSIHNNNEQNVMERAKTYNFATMRNHTVI